MIERFFRTLKGGTSPQVIAAFPGASRRGVVQGAAMTGWTRTAAHADITVGTRSDPRRPRITVLPPPARRR